jgi:kynurenine formamidase
MLQAELNRTTRLSGGFLTVIAATGALLAAAAPAPAEAQKEASVIERLQTDAPRNWGKWGDADEVGALNYLDAAQVKRGAQAVRSGKTFTLQIPMTHDDGPVFPGRVAMQHYMSQDEALYSSGKADPVAGGIKYSDDVAFMYLQGTTHVDALAHAWYGEQIYGGTSADSTVHGHAVADVAALGERGIVGRGTLLDVGRHRGGDNGRLPPNTCIHLKDLEATAKAQDIEVAKRDILVIRTGSLVRYYEDEPDAEWNAMNEPGLCYSRELLQWLDAMETPAILMDNIAIEKVVQEIDGEQLVIPLHGALMRDMGIVLSEINWLEDLAEDSADDGQYSFLLTAAPLKVEEGSGAPVNPVAVK